jgi:plastocyanin domain-containing protein
MSSQQGEEPDPVEEAILTAAYHFVLIVWRVFIILAMAVIGAIAGLGLIGFLIWFFIGRNK